MSPSLPVVRCAIYTRKSTEEGLEQSFNTLQAQRESAEAYILSHKQESWHTVPTVYNDGGFSGASLERPALKQLLADIEAHRIDCVVVYKVDRLSRSLLDFTRLLSLFRQAWRKLRLGDARLPYQHLHGPAHAEYPALVCALRARDHRGADTR